jgi:hypothetical protein
MMNSMTINDINERDLDALRRAVKWARAFQLHEPQIKLLPSTLPMEGSSEWFELAERLVSVAQSHNLALKPWQSCPADVAASGYANSPEEFELCRRMLDLGISVFEIDPATAIAEREQAAAPRRANKRK